jgi:hypothetical protein
LDGIPRHLPALARAEKLVKKARKAKLLNPPKAAPARTKTALGQLLFDLTAQAQAQGWSAEELLRGEIKRREGALRKAEAKVLKAEAKAKVR